MEEAIAKRTVFVRTDDFDGSELGSDEGQTIRITLDGAAYEIDLSDVDAQRLRDDFGKWLDKARRVSSGRGRGRASSGNTTRDYEPAAVRKWAELNGVEVPLADVFRRE